ncbi:MULTISPECIES: DUF3087 family protein [unclassified Agarivorans]|uniref:DUF3087 family protein n=1 Tax=unclassified Agarivorans TaxID=2636026 RepID=UPI0026E1EBC3|nr:MULTISPECIES: DUF3087 family protein [unclassified Agarivorans]MDO6687800.1 DUF3087 family protein [Agarivorans sp. 3_MG-2023]MDO6717336.1 DUF3087 family protein [Agarivorans sp. 2_MG-2023]
MQLKPVNKDIYQTRSRYSYIGISALLTLFTLVWSTLFIALFSIGSDNFYLNLMGVVAAVLSIVPVVLFCKTKPWFAEVIYVWELKQELNKINRKMASLSRASKHGDAIAFSIIKFSYLGSRQIWELDDNTLMLSELALSEQKLDELAQAQGLVIDTSQYHQTQLAKY